MTSVEVFDTSKFHGTRAAGSFEKGDVCYLARFLKNVGKIQATDSNDSSRPVGYDAKKF